MRLLSLIIITLLLLRSVYCGPYISTKPVILYSNGTESIWNTLQLKPKDFKNNTIIFDNLTQPPSAGLEGILYDRGYSCSIYNSSFGITATSVYKGGNRIALVKNGGNCNFYDKVYNSQLEGADGVIIYDNIPFQDDPEAGVQRIARGNITITMYYVDLDTGTELTRMLQYAATTSQPILAANNLSYQPAIHLVMHPDVGGFPADWIYILIIVIALLIVSFLASVGMHWHLWRIRRSQRTMFENGVLDMGNGLNTPQLVKKVLKQDSLVLFPTRIIGDRKPTLCRISSSRSSRALENADTVAKSADTPNNTQHEQQDDVCVICLDEFSEGEEVRQLTCGHEFHTECIDPWLTVKSASCPLCKHDCYVKQELDSTEPSNGETENIPLPPPQSFFSSLRTPSRSGSPASAFGPTISADRAEEFSRSWMARSLPRNMRRQINEAALAAAAAQQETTIELPARMTQPIEGINITVPPPNNPRPRLSDRVKSSLPRFLRS